MGQGASKHILFVFIFSVVKSDMLSVVPRAFYSNPHCPLDAAVPHTCPVTFQLLFQSSTPMSTDL